MIDLPLIVSRYEKLLLLRFLRLGDRLLEDFPELAVRSGFDRCWAEVGRARPETWSRAVRQPWLDAWVQCGERLAGLGLYQRYPDAHPRRHLAAFGGLLLSWATVLAPGSRGELALLGTTAVPLGFGEAMLVSTTGPRRGRLRWEVGTSRLRLHDLSGRPVAEVDREGLRVARVMQPGWRFLVLPRVAEVLVDLWTAEYCDREPEDRRQLEARWLELLKRARRSPGFETAVAPALRVATGPAGGSAPWVAGLARWPDPSTPGRALDAAEVTELACRDLVARLLTAVPLDSVPGGGPAARRLWTEVLAPRLARRCRGQPPGDESPQRAEWIRRLAGSEVGCEVLQALGETVESTEAEHPSRGRRGTPAEEAASRRTLPLPPQLLRSVGGPAVALFKSRPDHRHHRLDWSLLDRLSRIPEPVLEVMEHDLQPLATGGEEDAWAHAVLAYRLGSFSVCLEALARCLEFDSQVEEYWFLAAFSLRHLGWEEAFDRMVFGGERTLAWLPGAGSAGSTSTAERPGR